MLAHIMLENRIHFHFILGIYFYTIAIILLWSIAIAKPKFALWYHRLTIGSMAAIFIVFIILGYMSDPVPISDENIEIRREISRIVI